MDWKTASAHYEVRLNDTLAVLNHALDLAKLPEANVPEELTNTLLNLKEPAEKQLTRLRKREFRMAVVGFEKAGKSTFINAWLGCDLLPSDSGRCTYTTTQIYSVLGDEQRLEIIFRTQKQLEEYLQLLKDKINVDGEDPDKRENTDKLRNDVSSIEKNMESLSRVIQSGKINIEFQKIDAIREELFKYVANEEFAHAVLEARLYTNQLAEADGIVFYDVPGLGSGLKKHIDETSMMLSDCDAVILIHHKSDCREPEQTIIQFTKQGDQHVDVSDKLFLFLNRIDSEVSSQEALNKFIDKAYKSFDNWVPRNRIVYGGAGLYLVMSGLASKNTEEIVGNKEYVFSKIRQIMNISETDDFKFEDYLRFTGIQQIKRKVNEYINSDRINVLQKRCDLIIQQILNTSEKIRSVVKTRFSENPEEAQQIESRYQEREFERWWDQDKWPPINKVVNDYELQIQENISGSIQAIENFRKAYLQIVQSSMSKLRTNIIKYTEDVVIEAQRLGIVDPIEVNNKLRGKIFTEMSELLEEIAFQLAIDLRHEASQIIKALSLLLWDCPATKNILSRPAGDKSIASFSYNEDDLNQIESNYLLGLNYSLSVLFLRFARPMMQALILKPVSSDARYTEIERLGPDIEILDRYYSGNEEAYKRLRKYANYGFDLLYNPAVIEEVLGIATEISPPIGFALNITSNILEAISENSESSQSSVAVSSLKLVQLEVNSDIDAFEHYLCNAVFAAAGFKSYCIQELMRLLDKFKCLKKEWRNIAHYYWIERNPIFLADTSVPDTLKSKIYNIEVSLQLRELTTSLNNANLLKN